MAYSNDERRYSEEEFGLVLRMAAEVGDGPEVAPPREGLTLAQIREIAGEVGIDPERVSRAAALLPSTEDSAPTRLIGGSPRQRLQHTVSGVVSAEDLGGVIEVVRRALYIQGVTHEVMGGLEWTGSTGTASFGASITPREDETTLQVWTDRTESMAGIYGGVGMGVLGVVAVTMGKLVFGETDAGIVAALLSGLPPAFFAARELWKRSTKKSRVRLLRLLDGMAREADVATGGPEA